MFSIVNFQFHPKCEQLQVSHICFADDLFLSATANCDSARVLKRSLDEFGCISGLTPNLQKSSIFITGVDVGIKTEICGIMGMEVQSLPVKYLGVPLISTRLKVSDSDDLKNRILRKILSWRTRFLSYAGRIQLIISVFVRIQNYWSRIFVLPKSILKAIDAVLRKFLWSGTELRRTAVNVAWEGCLFA